MNRVYELVTWIFDPLLYFWEDARTKRALASGLVLAFLAGIACIELNRQGLLPAWAAAFTPTKHYYAIKLAFTLVLLIELVDLVFVLPCSVSKSVGKQFEILALILLRNAFKELTGFEEPIEISEPLRQVLPIVSDGVGAVLLFAGLGFYRSLLQHQGQEGEKAELYHFVAAKKTVALALLGVFAATGVWSLYLFFLVGDQHVEYFEIVYTVLIFSDILLVLVAQRHHPHFRSIFRNSGYALSTLLIRLALAAPRYYDVGLALTAMVLALGVTAAGMVHGKCSRH